MTVRHEPQRPSAMRAWMIGTRMDVQTPATNCPAALQTATANLRRLQQQRVTINATADKPKQMYPNTS